MTAYRLYLSDNVTVSPYPITSRELKTSAGASAVQHAPGEFDLNVAGPGETDSGQWLPTTNTANTTISVEIDSAASSQQSAVRQGWLWNQDLTGQTIASGAFTAQLNVSAVQGTGLQGCFLMRASVVSGATGTYETKNSLTQTQITGASSNSSGQSFWTTNDTGVAFGVSAGVSIISKTFTATVAHTFAAGERLLIELGFGNADSNTDRTWILQSNNSNTFIDTPNISYQMTPVVSAGTVNNATPMVMTKNLRPTPV